jgi:outer membrane lipase/esterase
MYKSVLCAAGFSVALSIIPERAAAQQIPLPAGGRLITFGDSLSDNGNLFGLTGNPPPPYFNGRFSNGPTWIELLAGGPMNQPFLTGNITGNVNLAFGGARTDNAPNLNGPIPGIPTQVGTFGALGGTYNARDTVTMWGGANNIFQYFQTAGAGATPAGIQATSVAAASDITGAVNQIAAQGAGRILVANLPDIGAAPDFNTSPPASAGASAATAIFNQALASGMAASARLNPNTNIVQMDVAAAFAVIRTNAAAFGFTNVTERCIGSLACITGGAAVQDRYLFWDGVHPTAAGHRLLALYAALLLNPEASAAAIAPLGEVAVRGRTNAMDDIFDRTQGWARGQFDRQNGMWASVTGSFANVDAHSGTPGYRTAVGGVRGGLDKATGNSLIGVSFGYSQGAISGNLRSDVKTFDVDGYATMLSGAYFITGTIGGAITSFDDVKRATGFGPIDATGSASYLQGSAGLEGGMISKVGGVTLIPSARLMYIHSAARGYGETAPLLAMQFQDRGIDAVIGGVRMRASTPVTGTAANVFGEIGYDRVLVDRQGDITATFVGNTAQAFSGKAGDLVGTGLNFKVGLDTKLSPAMQMSLSYGGAFQDGAGYSQKGEVRVKVPF